MQLKGIEKECGGTLLAALSKCSSLTHLKLTGSGQALDSTNVTILARTIEGCLELKQLVLERLKIGPEGTNLLTEALSKTGNSLQGLALLDCEIGDDGALSVTSVLLHAAQLKQLDLGGNDVGQKGAEHLAKALRRHTSLEGFNLARNSIGDTGAGYFAASLRQPSRLKTLNLSENGISDNGAEQLLEAFKTNRCLKTIYMNGNKTSGGQVWTKPCQPLPSS